MNINEREKQIVISLPESLIEKNIDSLKTLLVDYEFDKKIDDFKSKEIEIVIDSSNVNNVDFFGYQHVYGFCYYIKKKLLFDKLITSNKSESLINFEKLYGLKI